MKVQAVLVAVLTFLSMLVIPPAAEAKLRMAIIKVTGMVCDA